MQIRHTAVTAAVCLTVDMCVNRFIAIFAVTWFGFDDLVAREAGPSTPLKYAQFRMTGQRFGRGEKRGGKGLGGPTEEWRP